jgi:PAS domain S-box-containing protein
MNQVLDFFRKLFDTADWPPRWHCGNWTDFHGWLYIISDLLVWSAYFAIPLIILKFITRKTQAKFVRAYFLFAAFILACGSTHLLDAVTFWFPAYRLNALVRLITGIVSWATVFYTIRILPQAMSLKTHSELEKEVAERKKAEAELMHLNKLLNEAQDIAKLGSWHWEVKTNRLTWSDSLYRIYGLDKSEKEVTFEGFMNKVHPDDRTFVSEHIQSAINSGALQTYRHRIVMDDGTVKIMQGRGEVVRDENGEVLRMTGTGQEVTEHYQAQQELLTKTNELETANMELQKFAYVASHDLQEPLRKTLTFASLLKKEAENQLNEKAKSYVEKIVHSSSRMQQLIDDILNFSSLKTRDEVFENKNLTEILQQVLVDMEVAIEKSNAQINYHSLPAAEVIPTQVGQLFQNLLSNSLKFKRENESPVINISAKTVAGSKLAKEEKFSSYLKTLSVNHRLWEKEPFLLIEFEDNGVGFDPAYSEKIFEIFQRLHHGRSQGGTGIGLAICKRIMDNHHGIITAQSKPEKGASFLIVMPVSQKDFFV